MRPSSSSEAIASARISRSLKCLNFFRIPRCPRTRRAGRIAQTARRCHLDCCACRVDTFRRTPTLATWNCSEQRHWLWHAVVGSQHGFAALPQVFAGAADRREFAHQGSIKTTARGFLMKDLQRLLWGKRNPVRARNGQRVIDVRDLQNAGVHGNLLSAETVGISASVHPLVVVPDYPQNPTERSQRRTDVFSNHRMLSHDFHFFSVERPWLQKDAIRDRHLADVVKQTCDPEFLQFLILQAQTLSELN